MQIGRNEPCPCGSGKKYKKCCLNKDTAPSQELYYRRLSEAHDRLVGRLLSYAEVNLGEDAVDLAMNEFLLWPEPEDKISEDTLDRIGPLFLPWYLFNWEFDSMDIDVAGVDLGEDEDWTVAELYARHNPGKLDPLERRLMESIPRIPYSFWEVLGVDKGKGMTLQNILTKSRLEVQERSGSEFIQVGDLLFGRAIAVDGVGMLVGLSPNRIPPGKKADIIQLRKHLHQDNATITDDMLYDWEEQIRELYFIIDHSLHTMPQLCNTDGHPLEFHRLIYEVASADEAFNKLCGLCVTLTPEELYDDAECDESGRIRHAEFPWDRLGHTKSPAMPNTVLGRIMIDNHRLTAEANSAERSQELRREIDFRLGDCARFKVDEIQDINSMMSQDPTGDFEPKYSKEHNELIQNPEVQERLVEMIGAHWKSWVDETIPALGSITPREAVKTADGLEAVEALLKEAEMAGRQDPFMSEMNRKGIQCARDILGLNNL
ncbi:MAG: SEC-C domain-containing protein [Proteobacteria bacterium]|nr:SEC-C domain-containing protein [Pseudomonadota bacterium]